MMNRLLEILRGLRSNLKFTNKFQLIYDRLFRRDLPLTHYIWKNRLFFICNSKLGDHIAVQECLCERAYDSLLDQCQFPDKRISYVNIGANIGAFDLLLLDRGLMVEAGLAVELNPLTAARCLVNLQANGLFSTRMVNAGVAGTNEIISFNFLGLSLSDSIFTKPKPGKAGTPVELLTLETLLEKHAEPFRQFDLLKLDCEQAEYSIIRMTSVPVLQKFRYIIVEFHPEPKGETIHAAYDKLVAAGFRSRQTRPSQSRFTDVFIRS